MRSADGSEYLPNKRQKGSPENIARQPSRRPSTREESPTIPKPSSSGSYTRDRPNPPTSYSSAKPTPSSPTSRQRPPSLQLPASVPGSTLPGFYSTPFPTLRRHRSSSNLPIPVDEISTGLISTNGQRYSRDDICTGRIFADFPDLDFDAMRCRREQNVRRGSAVPSLAD